MASRNAFAYLIIVSLLILTFTPQALAEITQPTDLRLIDPPSTLQAGGSSYRLVVQAQLNGSMLMVDGIRVNLTSGDGTIIPANLSSLTDNLGRAAFNVSTTDKTGNVTLTATVAGTNVSLAMTFLVVGTGNVTGNVTDDAGAPVEAATVTVYAWDGSNKGEILNVSGNPAIVASGKFNFTNIPSGTYFIEAAGDNLSGHVIYTVDNGDQAVNITTASTVKPTPTPTPDVSPTATPSPTPTPKAENDKQAMGIIFAALIIAAIMLALVIAYRLLLKK